MLRYQEIFVPGGFPRHTYNPRTALNLEQRLEECKDNLCKLVTITGHTKSGKTVLTRKVLPPEESIWIDGGAVSQEEEFWQIIVEKLELFQGSEDDHSSESSNTLGAKGSAGANFLVARAKARSTPQLTKKPGPVQSDQEHYPHASLH